MAGIPGMTANQALALSGAYSALAPGAERWVGGALGGYPGPLGGIGNGPCSTLFVANLGATCTEWELTETFGR